MTTMVSHIHNSTHPHNMGPLLKKLAYNRMIMQNIINAVETRLNSLGNYTITYNGNTQVSIARNGCDSLVTVDKKRVYLPTGKVYMFVVKFTNAMFTSNIEFTFDSVDKAVDFIAKNAAWRVSA